MDKSSVNISCCVIIIVIIIMLLLEGSLSTFTNCVVRGSVYSCHSNNVSVNNSSSNNGAIKFFPVSGLHDWFSASSEFKIRGWILRGHWVDVRFISLILARSWERLKVVFGPLWSMAVPRQDCFCWLVSWWWLSLLSWVRAVHHRPPPLTFGSLFLWLN